MLTRSQQGVIEVCASEADKDVHLSARLTALTSPKVRGVDSTSQDKKRDVTPKQPRIGAWDGGDMHAVGHTGSSTAAIYWGASLPVTPEEEQK